MAKLTECGEITIERPNVTLKLTINPQRGLTGVCVGDVPSHIAQLGDDLERLTAALCKEAGEVADVAESVACVLNTAPGGEIVARHCDARKLTTDSNGSSFYLRVLMTSSTKPIPQLTMFELVDALLDYFKEYVRTAIEKAASRSIVTLANLGAVALTSPGPLGEIVRSDELHLGDRA